MKQRCPRLFSLGSKTRNSSPTQRSAQRAGCTEGKRGQGRAGPFSDVEQCSAEQRDYTYMQNAFSVFMSNADGEGASMPEADVN